MNNKNILTKWNIIFIIIILSWTIFHVYYLFLTSIKPAFLLLERPPRFFFSPSLQSYEKILIEDQYYQYFVNSTLIALGATILALFIGSLASFSFIQWKFRWKEAIFLSSLIGRMFPPVTTLIPIFFIMRSLKLLDSHLSLILVYASFEIPLVLMILRDFFGQVPAEIRECAFLDGCSSFQVFSKIVLPLAVNGILAAGVLTFVLSWNEFLFALVLTSFRAKTAPVALATFVENEGMLQWGAMAALGIFTILPVLIFMIFMNRFLVKGLTLGSLKG